MSGSQLKLEYEGMEDRHELYAKYGIAAEVAQPFQTELGTLLLALQGLENDWHIVPGGAVAREVLDTIDGSTLGRLLNDLKRHITIEGDLEEGFSSALNAGNGLCTASLRGTISRFRPRTACGR